MKHAYGGILCCLLGLSSVAVIQFVAQALSPSEINIVAASITVRIEELNSNSRGGSGVIINQQGTTFYVLTAKHVFNAPGSYEVVTIDNRRYPIDPNNIFEYPDLDLVEFQFSSDQLYRVAEIGNSDELTLGAPVYVAGWENPGEGTHNRIYSIEAGEINRFLDDPTGNGYFLGYNIVTRDGMSGGPVLNELGRLVGIHGTVERNLYAGIVGAMGIPVNGVLEASPSLGTGLEINGSQQGNQEDIDNLLTEAIGRSERRDYRGAIAALNRVVRLNPNSAQAFVERGRALVSMAKQGSGGYTDSHQAEQLALQDFNQAIQIDPNYTPAYVYRGLALLALLPVFAAYDSIMDVSDVYFSEELRNRLYPAEAGQALSDFEHVLQNNSEFDPIYLAIAQFHRCLFMQESAKENAGRPSRLFDNELHQSFLKVCGEAVGFSSATEQTFFPVFTGSISVADLIEKTTSIVNSIESCRRHELIFEEWSNNLLDPVLQEARDALSEQCIYQPIDAINPDEIWIP
jgi:S1-C subfamily serine protease